MYANLLRTGLGAALVLALTACSGFGGATANGSPPVGSRYTLIQMNLCLSGFAGCYHRVHYPAGVKDAIAQIDASHPQAVTLNEVCRGDIALIARATGYHWRFSTVIYNDRLLPCVHPGGRGLFGEAVLTRAEIERSATRAFKTQAGPERRVWLCVRSRVGVDVCTAHLASPDPAEVAANAPQCAELRAVLARRAPGGPVIFGGDVNHRGSCAPPGFWTRTDESARQDPGSQQVYGNGGFRAPSAHVVPARATDHDVLLVRAHLAARH